MAFRRPATSDNDGTIALAPPLAVGAKPTFLGVQVSFKLPSLAAAAACLMATGAHAATLANVYAGYVNDDTYMYYWNMSGVTFDDVKLTSVGGMFPGETEDLGSLPSGWTSTIPFNNATGAFAADYDDANGADPCPACDTDYQLVVTIGAKVFKSNVFSPSNNLSGGLVDFTGNHFDQNTAVCNSDGCRGQVLVAQVGAVPEPAAWSLMIGGFGLAGAALRRRRVAVAAA
jgi:hypothetical protein